MCSSLSERNKCKTILNCFYKDIPGFNYTDGNWGNCENDVILESVNNKASKN